MIKEGDHVEVLVAGMWQRGVVISTEGTVYNILVDGRMLKRMLGKLDITWRTLSSGV